MREMYNEEQKMAFVDSMPNYENERVKRNYENLFYSISKYESLIHKDFCEMNIPESKMVITSMGMPSNAALVTTITMLRDYNNWCIANGKTNSENSLNKIQSGDFDMSFSIRSKLLKSPEQLADILEKAFGNDATGYAKQSMLIAWLLFYGLTVEEVKSLKSSDIEAIGLKLQSTDSAKSNAAVVISLLNECANMYEVRTNGGKGGSEKVEYLIDSEYVLRSKQNVKSNPDGKFSDAVFLNRIRDIAEQYSNNTGLLLELSIDRIYRSGIFYRLYCMEQKGQELTQDIIYEAFKMKHTNKVTIYNEARKKIKDFENWKKAFELDK